MTAAGWQVGTHERLQAADAVRSITEKKNRSRRLQTTKLLPNEIWMKKKIEGIAIPSQQSRPPTPKHYDPNPINTTAFDETKTKVAKRKTAQSCRCKRLVERRMHYVMLYVRLAKHVSFQRCTLWWTAAARGGTSLAQQVQFVCSPLAPPIELSVVLGLGWTLNTHLYLLLTLVSQCHPFMAAGIPILVSVLVSCIITYSWISEHRYSVVNNKIISRWAYEWTGRSTLQVWHTHARRFWPSAVSSTHSHVNIT